jgi:hypothetical protein
MVCIQAEIQAVFQTLLSLRLLDQVDHPGGVLITVSSLSRKKLKNREKDTPTWQLSNSVNSSHKHTLRKLFDTLVSMS